MQKKQLRRIIDLCMVLLLPMLMAYSLIGEAFHEVAGTIMFGLFISHMIMNRGWYRALPKGKYNPERTARTILDLLLVIFMFVQPISGILMSKHLYTFISIPGISAAAREIHLVCAYWGFVLLCVHAGSHLGHPLGRLKDVDKRRWKCVVGTLAAVSAYGIYAFTKRGLADYMFMRTAFAFFDLSEPRIIFVADYVSIMVLFAMAGYAIILLLRRTAVSTGEHKEGVFNE